MTGVEGAGGRTLDDVLGDSAGRYLANGFARVLRSIEDCEISVRSGELVVSGNAIARYPDDWSVKGGRGRPAHLSSIDGILFAEELVVAALDTQGEALERPLLRGADLRAGTSAQTDLERVPVECVLRPLPGHERFSARCRLGSMNVELVFEAELDRLDALRARATADPVPLSRRTIVSDHDEWESALGPLEVHAKRLTARHRAIGRSGADRDRGAVMSIVDLLRLSAQQAQVLIYRLDGIDRTVADTLWMRTARFTAEAAEVSADPVEEGVEMTLEITRDRTLLLGEETWRRFEVAIADLPGMTAEASLVYRA